MSYSEEHSMKTLYVGNLPADITDDLLCTLFSNIGPVKGCKIIREAGNDPYAFVEFQNHQSASTALAAMNKRYFLDKEIKVNWATSPGNQMKTDTSNHHHIFVGDLSPEIEIETLREAFAPFGEISNCRIVKDPQTLKSKGYAFVSFVKRAEAENAIATMNGQWLGSRSIRTNWSTRKPPAPRAERVKQQTTSKQSTFEEVFNQTSPTNTTVYCGGFGNVSDDLIESTFARFGPIQDIRLFKDKGYAFIKFQTKESAARAIEEMHNGELNGNLVKCFWGKETQESFAVAVAPQPAPAAVVAAPAQQFSYQQYSDVGYWYPPNTFPAPQAQTALQPQFMPSAYTAAYPQYPYPQGYRVVPAPGWGMQAGPAPPGTTVMAYPVTQFQTQ